MIPLWGFEKRKPSTRQENVRGFKIVAMFLLSVAIIYIVVALSVFGHL